MTILEEGGCASVCSKSKTVAQPSDPKSAREKPGIYSYMCCGLGLVGAPPGLGPRPSQASRGSKRVVAVVVVAVVTVAGVGVAVVDAVCDCQIKCRPVTVMGASCKAFCCLCCDAGIGASYNVITSIFV